MARRKPLVTQHLENVPKEALIKYQNIIRDYIRNRQGIYALYRKGKPVYAGLASNLRARLKSHIRDARKVWDHFSVYLTIGTEYMKELESLILRIERPNRNRQKGKFAKSENIQNKIRQEHRKKAREEEEHLWGGKGFSREKKPKKEKPKRSKVTGRRPSLAPYIIEPCMYWL